MPGSELTAPGRYLFDDRVIEQPQTFELPAAYVGQQVVGDAKLIGEAGQGGYRVIADSDDEYVVPLRRRSLQLDQLRPAPGSPIGAAMDDHQPSPVGPAGVQVDQVVVLIGQRQVREPLPHPRTHDIEVDFR